MNNNQLHFVIGIWRSGTTLLREMLAMNESVQVFEEHSAILQTLQFRNDFKEQRLEIVQTIEQNKDFVDFAQPNFDFQNSGSSSVYNYADLIKLIYESSAGNSVGTFIDKNPIYSYYLPELLETFPKAKFIWMVREPKDNCISRRKQNIQSFTNSNYLASWWNITNEIIAFFAKLHPERFLLVHYENLVQNSVIQMKQICDFLAIEFSESMIEFEKGKEKRDLKFHSALLKSGRISDADFNSKISSLTANLQNPINTSKIGNWQEKLSPKEVKSIDSLCNSNYQKLLINDFNLESSNSIYNLLVQLSLRKLKFDIHKKRK